MQCIHIATDIQLFRRARDICEQCREILRCAFDQAVIVRWLAVIFRRLVRHVCILFYAAGPRAYEFVRDRKMATQDVHLRF